MKICLAVLALALGAIAAPSGDAQPAGKVYRIGFLGNSTAALEANLVGPFREGLRELGREGLHGDADMEHLFIDSTIVRAHQHSAGAQKKRGNKRSAARAAD